MYLHPRGMLVSSALWVSLQKKEQSKFQIYITFSV